MECAKTQNDMESLAHSGSAEVVDKRKENTWVESSKERSKRESENMVMVSELLGVEKLDEETRTCLQKGSRHLRKIRDEQRAAEEILEEVKQRRQQTEDDMWTEFEEYLASEDSEKRRSWCMECQNLANGTKQQYKGGEPGERLQ